MTTMSKRPATSPGPSSRLMDIPPGSADGGGGLRKRHSSSFAPGTPVAAPTAAPPRPPRNPARTAQQKPKKIKRPSTATGAREEVTPWEFFPNNTPTEQFPVLTSDDTAIKPETATGKREDVLPWELFPAPDYDAADPAAAAAAAAAAGASVLNGSQPNHTRSPRTSVSHSSASALAEMALLRRRKSTGAKAPTSPLVPHTHTTNSPRPSTSPLAPNTSPSKTAPRVLSKAPPASAARRPSIPERSSSGPVPTLASIDSMDTITPHNLANLQDPKFSTADRTILVELKRNISARAAQFVIKGGPAGAAPGERALGRSASTKRAGSKHHAYNRDDVPYPRSYAREALDLDVWETMACQRICDSLTFHVFTTPPTKVLDIGCGTGTWILNCGMAWKKCHFVGLDVVPLHPDVGTSEVSTRITWVQANFLDGLPFPNDEFDYVHIKRIALGVPEDKWDALFEEVARVLKSGGAFELIEEDLFFPGKSITEDADSDSDAVSELRYARNDSASDDNEDDVESVITGSCGSRKSYDGSAPTPNTSLGAVSTPPRTSSPLPMIGSLIREEIVEEAAEEPSKPAPPAKKLSLNTTPAHPPHHRHSYQPRISSASHTAPATSTTSLLAALGPAVVPIVPPTSWATKPRGYSTSTIGSPTNPNPPVPNHHPSVLSLKSAHSGDGMPPKPTFGTPFLLRTLPKAPLNPRDHSVLEGIYNEMNATRFINLSPLSLLANLVGLHFKDVRTHPPLQLTFPPPVAQLPESELTSSDSDSDSDDARNAIVPPPKKRMSMQSRSGFSFGSGPNTPHSAGFGDTSPVDEHRWVNTKDLLHRESRYIVLDEARRSAYSPSTHSSFPAMLPELDTPTEATGGGGAHKHRSDAHKHGHAHHPSVAKLQPIYRTPEGQNRLPNNTFNIDVRTLNMHLLMRVAEIMACSESMWEWVVSYQASSRVGGRARAGSLASEAPPRASRIIVRPDPERDAFKSAVLDLTREDFDNLLVRFELDMRDHIAIGSTLRDQFSWPITPMAPSQDRKAFHAACERWEQWQEHERRKLLSPYGRHQARNSIDSPYVHAPESNGAVPGGVPHKPDVIRGRSSLPESATSRSSSSRKRASGGGPDRRLSRSMRVFVAWKP
ncbi:hypothetical protein C8R45DRAFT_1069337 [Mycena sanguinolenta]|nr:hypothetical protein C8R45DRAFT_1069337 [Mycena sanguinolenta]